MKRRVWAAASAAMMATTAFGAQAVLADKYPNGQVKVFNWGEYIDEDLIDEFEDEYGIEVIYDTFDTNEAMYPRVEADPSLYDVIPFLPFFCAAGVGLMPFSLAQSATKRSSLPMEIGSPLKPRIHFPSHWLS